MAGSASGVSTGLKVCVVGSCLVSGVADTDLDAAADIESNAAHEPPPQTGEVDADCPSFGIDEHPTRNTEQTRTDNSFICSTYSPRGYSTYRRTTRTPSARTGSARLDGVRGTATAISRTPRPVHAQKQQYVSVSAQGEGTYLGPRRIGHVRIGAPGRSPSNVVSGRGLRCWPGRLPL